MTQEEAIQRFYDAVDAVITQDATIQAAVRDLNGVGLRVESFSMMASLARIVERAPAANADQDFLRKLRITPALEVRE